PPLGLQPVVRAGPAEAVPPPIHVLNLLQNCKTWMRGTSPRMTEFVGTASSKKSSQVGQAADSGGGVMEQDALLARRRARGQPLERIPDHFVGAGNLVDRKVALKHRP